MGQTGRHRRKGIHWFVTLCW